MRIVSREEEKANRRAEAQRTAETRDALYMKKFAEANLHLVMAELEFYTKRDKELRKK